MRGRVASDLGGACRFYEECAGFRWCGWIPLFTLIFFAFSVVCDHVEVECEVWLVVTLTHTLYLRELPVI